MLREMKNDILWCYRDDRKKMANTVFAFCLTVLCMLALIVILANEVNYGEDMGRRELNLEFGGVELREARQ